jgi:hypothetical protein
LAKLLGVLPLGWEGFQRAAAEVYPQEAPGGSSLDGEEDQYHLAYGLLKLLSDDERSRPHWAALQELEDARLSRPGVVLSLWKFFETDQGRSYIARFQRSVRYHREVLFDWFLYRYDLGSARRILLGREHFLIGHIHFLVLAFMVGIAALYLKRPLLFSPSGWGQHKLALGLVALVYFLAAGVQVLVFPKESASRLQRWAFAAQTLVPRLAAGSLVGLVALASSEELLRYVISGASPWRLGVVLVAALAYLSLEIVRRVHPMPPPRQLARLVAGAFITALAHAIAIAVCAERALRSIPRPPLAEAMTCIQLANVAAFLLAIGLIVNLIWAEEPVTQPL